jgi:hypothetical protein
MRAVVYLCLVSCLSVLGACSGGRTEELGCSRDEDCADGQCVDGACVDTGESSATVEAAGRADVPGIAVEHQVVGEEVCDEGEQIVCKLAPGSKIVWRAPTVEGYRFSGWTGDAGCTSSEPTLALSVSRDVTCIAHYVRRWRVVGSVGDGYGAVVVSSESPFASCTDGGCEVDEAAEVVLSAPARDGYRLAGWEGEGCVEGASTSRITVAPRSHVECRANYLESLTVRGSALGAEAPIAASSPSDTALCDETLCAVDPGANVVLTAPSVPGFRFAGWSGDERCNAIESELSIEDVRTNVSCSASYVPRFTVAALSEGVTPMPPIVATSQDAFARCEAAACEVDEGGGVVLYAPSVAGMRLASWQGEGCLAGNGATATVSDVRANLSCTASYVQGVAVIGTVLGADGVVEVASDAAGAECTPGRCVIDVGGSVTIAAPELPGRTFVGWEGDEGCSGAARTLTFSDVRASKSCSARFAARYQVSGLVAPAGSADVAATATVTTARCQTSGCNVDEGSAVKLTATGKPGFRFTGWSGGGACTGVAPSLTLQDVRSNVTCTANFVQRFEVRSNALPAAAGTTAASSQSAAAVCAADTCTVDARADVSVLASPAAGYRFVSWSGCADSTTNPLLLSALQEPKQCTANFERITYVVAAVASAGGTVSGSLGNQACAGASCTVPHGDDVTFSAAPATGYAFTGWSDCATSTEPTLVLSAVTRAQVCRATFTRLRVSVAAVGNEGGVVTALANGAACAGARCTVDYGGSVTVTAAPQAGFQFGGWSECSTSAGTTLRLDNVTTSRTCRATFTRMRFVITTDVAPAGSGEVTCSTAGCGAEFEGSLTLTARPASGAWKFTRWSGCATSTAATLTLDDITTTRNCVANFEPVSYPVVASVAASGGGDVNCKGAGCSVVHGEPIRLTATPASGFQFSSWACTPAVSSSAASFQIAAVTRPYSCVATFTPTVRTVRAVAGPNGSVSTCASGCSVNSGASITLRATGNAGFEPDQWSCTPALSGTGASLTIPAVSADTTCNVTFKPRTFTVTLQDSAGHAVRANHAGTDCPGGVCRNVPYNGGVSGFVTVAGSLERGAPLLVRWRGCAQASIALGARTEGSYDFDSFIGGVTSDLTCVAEYVSAAEVDAYTSPPEMGTAKVTFTGGVGYCEQISNHHICWMEGGSTPTLSYTVKPGYRFVGWRCTDDTKAPPQPTEPYSGRPVTASQLAKCGAIFGEPIELI